MKSPPAAPAAGAYSAVSRKLMESMGWTEGKGLGKHEQGAERHVEHKKRGDNVGLGADATVEAQFAAGLHKGSAKAAFGDQGWVDAFAGALDSMNEKKKKKKKKKKAKLAKKDSSQNFLDECFAATGGARLGMRAQRSGGGKLRRAEAAAPPAKRARADETPEERRERKLRKKRRREAKKAAAEAL